MLNRAVKKKKKQFYNLQTATLNISIICCTCISFLSYLTHPLSPSSFEEVQVNSPTFQPSIPFPSKSKQKPKQNQTHPPGTCAWLATPHTTLPTSLHKPALCFWQKQSVFYFPSPRRGPGVNWCEHNVICFKQ